MPSTVEKLSPTRAKLTVEIPFHTLQPHLDQAYKSIAEQVTIPGFRKGKVPPNVIDVRFGRGVVLQEAINAALPDAYQRALNEHQISVLGQPEVEVTKLEDGDVVEFTAEVDVRPEFDLPDTSDIAVEVDPVEVNDEQVEERVNLLRQRFATTNEVDRAAADGDVVVVDLKGSLDGEPLEDATAEGITYQIGNGGMLDGLDEAVVGLKSGESKQFRSTLVGGALKGTECDIEVTLQKVSEQELPEVDDEFAQMVSEFDTVDQMRADLRDGLTRMARLDQATSARDKVLEAIIAKTEIPLPEALAAAELDARRSQVNAQLAQAGLTLEQYLADSDEETDDEEGFWADIENRTFDALKAQLLLDKYADENDIGVEQAELSQLIVRKAAQAGTSPEQEAQHMMEHNHLPEWMQEVRRTKALGALVENAKVTDTAGASVDLSAINPDGTIKEVEEGADEPAAEEAPADEAKPKAKRSSKKKAAEKSDEDAEA
ncbi:trigger factor [Aestuariimicrobium ganziense]|uniref:trigger factor n=1 Tax=Aestuariimicrobium ganziense TaxID=2773677 RepID=UPI0019447565|nr:trigger factor [Aestuariimicrobium ganziense]